MCKNRWNLPRERCLGIESKIKTKWRLWQWITSHHPRWRLFCVAVPTGGCRIGARLVSIGVDWAFNWLFEKMGENPLVSWSSCEFDLKERRERGCDRGGGVTHLSKIYLIDQIGVLIGRWFESRMSGVVVAFLGHFEVFFCWDFKMSEAFGLEN